MNEVAWTPYDFLIRFTAAERAAIRTAAASDSNVADILEMFRAADWIGNTDQRVIQSMAYLTGANLITQTRSDEILGV